MEFLNIIVAAIAGFAFGAVWYMLLAEPWMAAAKIEKGADGKPKNSSDPKPYIMAMVAMIFVAGMMRHVFASSGVMTVGGGLISGLGIGAFFISPWIMINNAYGGRPFKLTLIDGGYAVFGCAVIGAVLNLF